MSFIAPHWGNSGVTAALRYVGSHKSSKSVKNISKFRINITLYNIIILTKNSVVLRNGNSVLRPKRCASEYNVL